MSTKILKREVSRNFNTYAEGEAFHDGVAVVMGLFPPETGDRITIGYLMPLSPKGYTTTITAEREI